MNILLLHNKSIGQGSPIHHVGEVLGNKLVAAACVHQLVDSFQGQGIQQAAEIALGPQLQPC